MMSPAVVDTCPTTLQSLRLASRMCLRTGNHTLHAIGVARTVKHYGGTVAISQGEASTSEGYVYEALNRGVGRG